MRRGALAATLALLFGCQTADSPPDPLAGAELSRRDHYPAILARFGDVPFGTAYAVPHEAFRVVIEPSFRTAVLVAGTTERFGDEAIGLFAVALRPDRAEPLYERSAEAYGQSWTVQRHRDRRPADRIVEIAADLTEAVSRSVASSEARCLDGTLVFVEVVRDGRSEISAAHSCDPGFERLLAAMRPALREAAATVPPLADGLAAYAEGRFGRFGAAPLSPMTPDQAAGMAGPTARPLAE